MDYLYCSLCGEKYKLKEILFRCPQCNEPLEVAYELPEINKEDLRRREDSLWKYKEFFPFGDKLKKISLNEGGTPLVKSSNLGRKIGLKNLYFKNDILNPTGSFKDRGTSVGISWALHLGFDKVGTVSTGNMAVSVGAYAAKAEIKSFILVSAGIPENKLGHISTFNPLILEVEGDYGELYYESLKIGKKRGIYFINSDNPFRVEGQKTVAFEICEKFSFDVPDFVFIPLSSGGNFSAIYKGFKEFYDLGFIDKIPKLIGVQAKGCSPIANAFEKREKEVERLKNPQTVAHAIANPFPPSGNRVLRILKEEKGKVISVSDEEILNAQRLLSKYEGIFCQPASATSVASVIKLKENGFLKGKEVIVSLLTGNGLNDPSVFKHYKPNLKITKFSNLDSLIS
ncbi:MAG: threonine synthase [Candidatus Aerophobetes bacterium]|nr:threonine synthase [Candidatus Aerophobetes bacterium]